MILSAQATDKSVNKATAQLVPRGEHAGGDAGARRRRALAVHQVDRPVQQQGQEHHCHLPSCCSSEHGGEVPRTREALEQLPGVGRKTANVILNTAFGEATMAVDTHIFRVANRTGLAPGKTVREVEDKLLKFVPPEFLPGCASLADPARPLRLQGAQSRLPRAASSRICASIGTRRRPAS